MCMKKPIYFADLTEQKQNQILDQYGATSAHDLGLDINPYAYAWFDWDGEPMGIELLEPAV